MCDGVAAHALGAAFFHVPDKDRAWKDLHRLALDIDRDVRRRAAKALGAAFVHVPDKDLAWNDLVMLALDWGLRYFIKSCMCPG